MKLAILFSGQGSQYQGMGLDLINSNENILKKVKEYENILKIPLLKILENEELLNDTRYTQPAMVMLQILLFDQVKEKYNLKIEGMMGFSLGEFSAYYGSGIFDDIDTLKIVNKRALLMQEASNKYPGKMAAIIGLNDEVVENICQVVSTKDDFVEPVNYNSDGQLVISGSLNKLNEAIDLSKEKGAKRALLLNVFGPFHSKYMSDASNHLYEYIKDFKVKEPNTLIYGNVDAIPINKKDVYLEIKSQIKSAVLFKQTIRNMINDGFTHFLEIGPGKVLLNLIKRIDKNVGLYEYNEENLNELKEIF